ncbi:MAG TPA: hypothetical protein VNF68_10870 [Candidatus Baltobacteraceae bacterium]|nr:hypothetical protein [Candidatus Baltobacteraceae bacterium]
MMRVAVDVDGVIADIFAGVRTAQDLGEAMREPGFFTRLQPIAGALEGLLAIARAYDVIVVSSAMHVPHAFAEKFAWLRRHLPWLEPDRIVFCGDKRVVAAEVLIDDGSHHLATFGGHGILFASPLNADDPWPHRVERWSELLDAVSAYAVRR